MKKRSIGLMILLMIVTVGIYNLYWYCSFQNQLKKQTGEGFTGVGHFFVSMFTFGIYFVIWQYLAGKRLAKLGASDNSVLYLVLVLVGLGVLNPFLMQSAANGLKG